MAGMGLTHRDLKPENVRDLRFMREVRLATNAELEMMLQWQCTEWWRRIAVKREIDRRRQGWRR